MPQAFTTLLPAAPRLQSLPCELHWQIFNYLGDAEIACLGRQSRQLRQSADDWARIDQRDPIACVTQAPAWLPRTLSARGPQSWQQHTRSAIYTDGEVAMLHAMALRQPQSVAALRRAGCWSMPLAGDERPGGLRLWAWLAGCTTQELLEEAPLHFDEGEGAWADLFRPPFDVPRQNLIELGFAALEMQSAALFDAVRHARHGWRVFYHQQSHWLARAASLPVHARDWAYRFLLLDHQRGEPIDPIRLATDAFYFTCLSDKPQVSALQFLRAQGAYRDEWGTDNAFMPVYALLGGPAEYAEADLHARSEALSWLWGLRPANASCSMWFAACFARSCVARAWSEQEDQNQLAWRVHALRFALRHGLSPVAAQREGLDVALEAARRGWWVKALFADLIEANAELGEPGANGPNVYTTLAQLQPRRLMPWPQYRLWLRYGEHEEDLSAASEVRSEAERRQFFAFLRQQQARARVQSSQGISRVVWQARLLARIVYSGPSSRSQKPGGGKRP